MLSKEEIMRDLIFLQRIGLIEVTAINDEGEELWALTKLARSLSEEQISELLDKTTE